MTKRSDLDTFAALVDTHGPAVVGLLRRLCRNQHDADDAFQETALRVWRSFARRPRLRNPRAWLMTIAYRAFLDQQSRRKDNEPALEPPDAKAHSPADAASRAEESERLRREVNGLPEPMRQVVTLHYSGGLSLHETAQTMEISLGTAKSRLNAALKQLRSVLE